MGYDSTNIFRIWTPSRRKVIRSRDVLFNEDEIYDPTDTPDLFHFLSQPLGSSQPYLITENMRLAFSDLDSENERLTNTFTKEWFTEKTPHIQDSIQVTSNDADKEPQLHNLPTPEDTPLPTTPIDKDISGLPEITSHQQPPAPPPVNTAPRASQISADLDPSNIDPEGAKRHSKPTNRKDAYTTQLSLAKQGSLQIYHNSFAALSSNALYLDSYPQSALLSSQATAQEELSHTRPTTRFHRDNLPPEPKNFKELANHPFTEQFKGAMRTEIDALNKKNTWVLASTEDAIQAKKVPIPTMWTYKYKFDEFGWLIKFKARLVARGDLQHTDMDTFAATLAARLFRFLMALTANFDLETRQYDAVNAFANSTINEPTFCKVPPGWIGKTNILLLLQKALYGLKQSPALWYKELSSTLVDLGLEPISGIECVYTNQYMIVFFFCR